MSKISGDMKREFKQWADGPGESLIGGAIKAAAKREQKRLNESLSDGHLFPHLEHEDRVALEKAKRAEEQGERMVTRSRRRQKGMRMLKDLLPQEKE